MFIMLWVTNGEEIMVNYLKCGHRMYSFPVVANQVNRG